MRLIQLLLLAILTHNCQSQPKNEFEAKRIGMVESQIECRGITDAHTLRAMRKVPRHAFVPPEYRHLAYTDGPLPIGQGQTISQPYIVAFMTEAVHPVKGKKALEIGTGSGYQAAVLAEIVDSVYTIEIIEELAGMASATLKKLGYTNIVVKTGDGYKGWPQYAPFDIIIVTAACNHIPQPLLDQLAENGRMIIPVGEQGTVQELVLITRNNGKIRKEIMLPVRFVPFTRDE